METSFTILEKPSAYIDHDRLFKELIQVFFQDFMQVFFPEKHDRINFSTVKFLEQEVFTDILKGEKRRIDMLAEVSLKEEQQLILIHVEPQSYYQESFHERMFIYCSRLYEKFRKPILPIAIFSYNDNKIPRDQFLMHLFNETIFQFNYHQLHLRTLNWRKYIEQQNPVSAALLSKMGYTENERVQVKLEFLRILSKMELNPAKTKLIYGFFETYLKLNKEEEKQMYKEIENLPDEEAERVLELPNSYREEGILIGIEKGKELGIEKNKQQMVRSMLEKNMPIELIAEIAEISVSRVKELKKDL